MKPLANIENKLSTFQQLIFPVGISSFMKETWLKKSLFVDRKNSDFYKDILSVHDIDLLLQNENLTPALFRILSDGVNKGKDTVFYKNKQYERTDETVADSKELIALLKKGCTVEINARNDVFPKLTAYLNTIGKELCMSSVCKIFITPPKAKALHAHFDLHQVFVLQISGTKNWKLYEINDRMKCDSNDPDQEKVELGEPSLEKTLYPGDLLYVPGGMVHEAFSESETSIHITIGIKPLQWFDLFQDMKATAMDNLIFHQGIPEISTDQNELDAFKQAFIESAKTLLDEFDFESAMLKRKEKIVEEYEENTRSQFSSWVASEQMDSNTLLIRNKNKKCTTSVLNNRVVLQMGTHDLKLPAVMKPLIENMLSLDKFKLNELETNLQQPMLIEIAKKLVKENLFHIEA